jgi:hypothetical protein
MKYVNLFTSPRNLFKLVFAICSIFLAIAINNPVQAQSWGTATVSGSSNNPAHMTYPGAPPITWSLPIGDGNNLASYNGSWTISFNWNGGTIGLPAPATSYWKESVYATVGGTGSGAAISTDPLFSISNQFSPVAPGSSLIAGVMIESGSKLSQKSGSTVTFNPTCIGTAPMYGGGTTFWYNVVPDSRGVTLTRPGATSLDTIYSLNETANAQTEIQNPNNVTIQAVLVGNWGTRSSWSWSPTPQDTSNPVSTSFQMPYSGMTYDLDGHAFNPPIGSRTGPQSYQVNYTCTDSNDGASANASYLLTVHDPLENWRTDPNNVPTPHGNHFFATFNGVTYGVIGPVSGATASVTFTGSVSLTGSLSGNVKASDVVSFGVNYGATIGASAGVTLSVTSPSVAAGYAQYPYLLYTHQTNHYLVDQYSASGFGGTASQSVDSSSGAAALLGWTAPQRSTDPAPKASDLDY